MSVRPLPSMRQVKLDAFKQFQLGTYTVIVYKLSTYIIWVYLLGIKMGLAWCHLCRLLASRRDVNDVIIVVVVFWQEAYWPHERSNLLTLLMSLSNPFESWDLEGFNLKGRKRQETKSVILIRKRCSRLTLFDRWEENFVRMWSHWRRLASSVARLGENSPVRQN